MMLLWKGTEKWVQVHGKYQHVSFVAKCSRVTTTFNDMREYIQEKSLMNVKSATRHLMWRVHFRDTITCTIKMAHFNSFSFYPFVIRIRCENICSWVKKMCNGTYICRIMPDILTPELLYFNHIYHPSVLHIGIVDLLDNGQLWEGSSRGRAREKNLCIK